jgi:hypothetical protein
MGLSSSHSSSKQTLSLQAEAGTQPTINWHTSFTSVITTFLMVYSAVFKQQHDPCAMHQALHAVVRPLHSSSSSSSSSIAQAINNS